MDGGKAGVAGADAVVAVPFEMIQEGAYQRSVEVSDVEVTGFLVNTFVAVAEQESEGIAVGSDGVRTRAALAHESVGEERLEGGGECGHSLPPNRPSRRVAANSINSGAAERYQYVPTGLTCPR